MAISLIHLEASDFPDIVPFIQDALVTGGGIRDWDLNDIYEMASNRQIDLWAMRDGAETFGGAVSVIRSFSKRKVFEILLMGTFHHREKDWRVVLDLVKDVARRIGATTISGTGRPGWARKLGAREQRIFEIDVSPA